MDTGNGLTVMTAVTEHPLAKIYVMVAIPALIPVTMPLEEPIAAIPGADDTHLPPPASVRDVAWPTHTLVAPEIGPGNGLTETIVTAAHKIPGAIA